MEGEKVTFGDVFSLDCSDIASGTIKDVIDGEYRFVTGAKYENWKLIDSYDFEGEYIFMGVGGNGDSVPIKYFNGKFKFSNLMARLLVKDKYVGKINVEYFYNLLLKNQSYLEENMQKGSSNRTLQDGRLANMYITIPSMCDQELFVEQIRKFEEDAKELELKLKNVQENQRKYIDDYF